MGPDAKVDHSMVTGGCEVYGTVENSVLFHSVQGGGGRPGALLHPDARHGGQGRAVVEYAIVAEESVIGENARVGASPDGSEDWGFAVMAQHLKVGRAPWFPPRPWLPVT